VWATVWGLRVVVVKNENLDGLVVGRAEPVRKLRVELSNLAGAHRDVVLAEDKPHLTAKDVKPCVAAVDAELGLALLGGDQDLPGVDFGVVLAERDDDTTVALPGF